MDSRSENQKPRISRQGASIKLFRFAIVGAVSTIGYVGAMVTLVEVLYIPAIIATALSWFLALLASYMANHRWTFEASGNHAKHLPKYIFVAIVGLCVNMTIMHITVNMLGLWYRIGVVLVIFIVPLFTFSLNHYWIFRTVPKQI